MIINNDCLEAMKKLIDDGVQVDSIVTDPPYELGFMAKSWDSTGIAFRKETWELALKLLKPGGHLLAFSASRNYHRMTVAIEDAGFEIRDQLMWIYGSGFPKSYNIGKGVDKKLGNEREVVGKGKAGAAFHYGAVGDGGFGNTFDGNGTASSEWETTQGKSEWEGWGTALKPAHEPIVMARKSIEGSIVDNVLKHGTGGINIDGCRVDLDGDKKQATAGRRTIKWGVNEGGSTYEKGTGAVYTETGRFPANVMHDGSEEVVSGFPNTGQGGGKPYSYTGREYDNKDTSMFNGDKPQAPSNYNDMGTAARFFYCPKVSKSERGEDNTHPTVKPQELMKYLCRLVTPKGGTVLDPFMGSGSTGTACKDEGFEFIGIEREKEYFEIAEKRINSASPLMEFM